MVMEGNIPVLQSIKYLEKLIPYRHVTIRFSA